MSAVTDISGMRFGRLTVIGRAGSNKNGRALWNCQCDCGAFTVVKGNALLSGNTKSCGCLNFSDITGKRFGRLTAICPDNSRSNSHGKYWICRCDCGAYCSVFRSNLVCGGTESCGRGKCRNTRKTHGGSYERLYHVWADMRRRCISPQCSNYSSYGGRGITVCEEWKGKPKTFIEWALSNGYSDTLTIDRINVNGNYEPSNCRWIPMSEQYKNKQSNSGKMPLPEPYKGDDK